MRSPFGFFRGATHPKKVRYPAHPPKKSPLPRAPTEKNLRVEHTRLGRTHEALDTKKKKSCPNSRPIDEHQEAGRGIQC